VTPERGLKPQERLQFHQERSGPVMEELQRWLEAQFAERKTEPNSSLGKAIAYLLWHWRPYRTLNGAQVGDLFMSLIHTCQLCGANSFDYLTELQRHAEKLATRPAEWMPWNYRQTLDRIVSLSVSA